MYPCIDLNLDNYELQAGTDQNSIMDELHGFVDMIFNKEATAKAYVEKLYRFFIKSEWSSVDEINIINPLTQQMIDNDYEIMPIVRTLLSSQHFYDAGRALPVEDHSFR